VTSKPEFNTQGQLKLDFWDDIINVEQISSHFKKRGGEKYDARLSILLAIPQMQAI